MELMSQNQRRHSFFVQFARWRHRGQSLPSPTASCFMAVCLCILYDSTVMWHHSSTYLFEPIAVENLGAFSSSTLNVLSDLGRRINDNSGDARETSCLFQRISVAIQRFNCVLLHDSDCRLAGPIAIQLLVLILFVFNPGDLYYLG